MPLEVLNRFVNNATSSTKLIVAPIVCYSLETINVKWIWPTAVVPSKHRTWNAFLVDLWTAPDYTSLKSTAPRGLKHELPSPTQTLGSWIRIPLKAWMSVCVYSVFVLSCVQVAALLRADPPSKESYWLCKRSRNWKKRPRSNKGKQSHIQIDR
jgi:hypothetical protein